MLNVLGGERRLLCAGQAAVEARSGELQERAWSQGVWAACHGQHPGPCTPAEHLAVLLCVVHSGTARTAQLCCRQRNAQRMGKHPGHPGNILLYFHQY